MRRLLLVLVVLVLVGVGADFVAARVFEGKVAAAIARRVDLERPIVQVRDFPFLPHLALGRFHTIDVAASDARARGVTASRVEFHLHDVLVPRDVLLGRPGQVTVGRADGQVTLSEAEVNRLVGQRLQGAAIELTGEGVRLRVSTEVLGQTVQGTVDGVLEARGGQIAFKPSRIGGVGTLDPALQRALLSRFDVEVPLPRLPGDVQVERVVTAPHALVVSGRARAVQVAA
jgi:hypothetical protein